MMTVCDCSGVHVAAAVVLIVYVVAVMAIFWILPLGFFIWVRSIDNGIDYMLFVTSIYSAKVTRR